MERDEAKAAYDALDMLWRRIDYRDPYFREEAWELVEEVRAALSSPCAICGGKEPIPGWVRPEIFDGAVGRGIPAGFSIMLQPDDVYTKPISFIVLPTKEGVPAFRQGFADGSTLLLEEPDFPGVPGAWEEEPCS